VRFVFSFLSVLVLLVPHARAATEIPFVFRDGLIWVKAHTGGQTLNFLLDSGAGTTVLDLRAARRLGVELGRRQAVQGVDGEASAYRVKGFTASVGGVDAASAELAIDLSGPGACCHQRIDGLLGADFFRSRIVQIDFAAQRIRLLERGEESRAAGEAIPLSARNGILCAKVSVNGSDAGWLRLDTGCRTALEWVVTGDKAARRIPTLGLHPGTARDCCTDVQLGAKRIAGVKTGIHTRQMFAGEAGLIGNGLLSRFTVTIDAARRCCVLGAR
jgi:hypothetical protein